jgi:pyruvate dehydrogenase E1 component beta subunit
MDDVVTLGVAFKQALDEEMERDEGVVVIGTDMFRRGGHFAQARGLGEKYGPKRIRNAPISESAIVAAGIGAAMNGLRPVVDLNFVDFALSAMDEIVNQLAKVRYMWGRPVPLVLRVSCGTAAYAVQHNNSMESTFAHVPGLVVVQPSTPADAKGILKTALRGDDPVIYFMHKKLGSLRGPVGGPEDVVPLGKAVSRRSGGAATIATFGLMVHASLEAAEQLSADGIEVEVIDLRTLYPLDMAPILRSVRATGRAIVVAEEVGFAGITAEVSARIQESAFEYLDAPVARVTLPHTPTPHSPALIDVLVPTSETIAQAVRDSIEAYPPSDDVALS